MSEAENCIRQLRKTRGLTMRALADAMGTTQQQIDRLEKGQRRLTLEWMQKLSLALGCELFHLLPEHSENARDVLRTSRVRVVGDVLPDHSVRWLEPDDAYPLIVSRPRIRPGSRLFALHVPRATPWFAENSDLVFAELATQESLPADSRGFVFCMDDPSALTQGGTIQQLPVENSTTVIRARLIRTVCDVIE